MGSRAWALPADKIAIGSRGAALPRRNDFAIGTQAHRAAGLAPLETSLSENAIQPLLLRLRLYQTGTGYDPGLNMRFYAMAFDHCGCATQVRSEEHTSELQSR